MNVYVHTLLQQELVSHLQASLSENHHLSFRTNNSPEIPESFLSAQAILGNPPLSWFETNPPKGLLFWQLDSAGFDQYKSVGTSARVANMGDWFAWPCAETIVGGVLSLYRGLNKLALLQSKQKWIGTPLREELHLLHKKKVMVLGAGTIGLAVNSILSGFGAATTLVARSAPQASVHSREEALKVLPHSDLVINTLPGAAGKYVDAVFLQAMKAGSVYANVGRGSTTDEAELIRLLSAGYLGGAVLDVTENEPLPADSPLWGMPQVILTQHTGGGQANEDVGKANLFIENLGRFEKDEPLLHEVDLKNGY
ncbi:D-2-hydroxyacid dehydrogenase [Ravibacter arvi]|uniref:D-2-hydroxyacid dehydrogenase n=1 Tax=Ravibacter arvi TaxID=2051041 RepID=A0ABP8LZR1_9BACT